MNREFAQKIYRYFLNTLMLGLIPLNDKLVEDSFSKYKELILKALPICDSDISDVKLTHEKIKMPIPNIEEQMKIAFKEAEIDSIKIETFHQFNEKISFDIETEESNGTKKLFAVLIRLIDVVKNQKSLMLDEFDASLHTRLADFILDLIHSSSKAQFLSIKITKALQMFILYMIIKIFEKIWMRKKDICKGDLMPFLM